MTSTNRRSVKALPALIAAALLGATSAHAATTIDLGAADGYSAFIFGNVGAASGRNISSGFRDVEGRLAAGGNVNLTGFSVGEKNAAGSTGASIVAGGNINIGTGAIDNGSKDGTAVYGVSNSAATASTQQWFADGTFSKGNSATLDFAAAQKQLTSLSTSVSQLAANGSVVAQNSGFTLVGDKNADVDIFNINASSLANLTLDLGSLKSTAHIIINDGASTIDMSGDYASFAGFSDRTLFNFADATKTSVSTYVYGSILTPLATFSGTGHLEGTLVADSVVATASGSTVEIGANSFKGVTVSAVPEPDSIALMLAGVGLVGFMLRRKTA